MEQVFAAEDEDEAAEERRAAAAADAAAQAARAAARAAAKPKPLDQGGGMYLYERVALGARRAWAKLTQGGPSGDKPQPVGAPASQEQATAAKSA
jgi:hypothetical protein